MVLRPLAARRHRPLGGDASAQQNVGFAQKRRGPCLQAQAKFVMVLKDSIAVLIAGSDRAPRKNGDSGPNNAKQRTGPPDT
jgi:hypothetical protein